MITKQQALEFIYELSKEATIDIDIPSGIIGINGDNEFGYDYKVEDKCYTKLEVLISRLIKDNLNSKLFKRLKFPIPVDVDMLEVGQTYKVELDDFYDGCHSVHIAKYVGKKEEYYYFENRHTWRYEKKDLYQLWKMNKKESEEE